MRNEMIIKKIENEVTRICKEVGNEFNIFERSQLSLAAEQVYRNAYKISSMTDLFYYFMNYGFSDFISATICVYENDNGKLMQIYDTLSKIKTEILQTLYEKQFDCEKVYTSLWEDIDLLVKNAFFDEVI